MILEDSYIKFIIDNKLTQGQFLLLYLLYKNRPDLIKQYKERFPSEDGTMIGQYFIDDLFTRGFLEKLASGTIRVTKVFLEAFINKHTASDQIFDIYPTHFNMSGTTIPLTAMDRNLFADLYDIAIQSSIHEHLEIVEDIHYAIKHELLKIGIDKFIKSKYWTVIRPMRLENQIKERVQTIRDHDF